MTSRISFVRRASAALLLVLAGCAPKTGETIQIGLAGPFGKANGESMKLAAEMAVDEINRRGGVDGRRLELVQMDDEADRSKAISVAHELRGNPRVLAVIGHVGSANSRAAAPIYNAAADTTGTPVLQISPASSAPELTQEGYRYTFRVCPTDLEFSPRLAEWARGLGRSRAALIYENDDYGRGVVTTFRTAFHAAGGRVVSADPYLRDQTVQNPQALDAYLTRALSRNADALVIGGQAEAGLVIIQAARRLGYTGPILGADGITGVKDGGPPG
jgi:branched-chain amino acid transport system substrate-binding protein